MSNITLSSKHQITLPVEIVRALGLKAGDCLVAELIEDRIVLLPKPQSWVNHFAGSLKGVYGSTNEEIDQYIAEERGRYDRDEWREQFYDLIATDEVTRKIVEVLRRRPNNVGHEGDFMGHGLSYAKGLREALERLIRHGAVRRLEPPPEIAIYTHVYRLVRDFAEG